MVQQRKYSWLQRSNNSVKSSLLSIETWRSASSEFIATFLLFFIICMSSINAKIDGPRDDVRSLSQLKFLQQSVAIALSYATLLQCFHNVSGGHMNPAVSCCMFVAGRINFVVLVLHVIFQICGSIIAILLFYGFEPSQDDYLSSIIPKTHLLPWQSFCIETVQSLLLSMVWLSSSDPQNRKKEDLTNNNLLAVHVGFALLGNTLWANTLTGASINPARCIAPLIFYSHYEGLIWVYITGPIAGAVVGAILYKQLFTAIPQVQNNQFLHDFSTVENSTTGEFESSLREITSEKKYSSTLRKVEGKIDDDIHEKIIMTLRKPITESKERISTRPQKLFLVSQQPLDRRDESLLGNSML